MKFSSSGGERGQAVARIDDLLDQALRSVGDKPDDTAQASIKKRYSERISEAVAAAIAEELRQRGLAGARPAPPGVIGDSGAERRMAGGIGAKKVDVTWATEESGLLLGISVKTINFRDKKSGNFQKNLTNRRGDMLIEAVTLHRRFPYSVLAGLLFLDKDAETDHTAQRRSTFENAHLRLKLFAGRDDPAGRDEQFERFFLLLLDAGAAHSSLRAFAVGDKDNQVPMEQVIDQLIEIVAVRNPDFYLYEGGQLGKL
ncbi:hypothetical protein JQC91_04625 [Jannaschia sp. Os4]|uniref:hypothetical protein n=1 Tax=Jannaschia sp. Os4 TaxID=2807617 RepID=UPI00193AA32E|nr:hypothetical protein [Jannaschia sp. Os4]MBM2575582.1 hypothetical protein [Jannaschia sp. Os4]